MRKRGALPVLVYYPLRTGNYLNGRRCSIDKVERYNCGCAGCVVVIVHEPANTLVSFSAYYSSYYAKRSSFHH